jgi:hypothetical protein
MVMQMLFGKGYVFEGNGPLAAFKLEKFVNPNPPHLLSFKSNSVCLALFAAFRLCEGAGGRPADAVFSSAAAIF